MSFCLVETFWLSQFIIRSWWLQVTGNLEDIAWLKMEGLGIRQYFSVPNFGGYCSWYPVHFTVLECVAVICWLIFGFNCNSCETFILLDSFSFGSDHSERGELVRIAANRAEQLFPGGFRLRAHVGDTVRPSLIFEIWSLCCYHILIQQEVHACLTCH